MRSRRSSATAGASPPSSTTARSLEDAETVRAAGAATALLLENQRLDAELRAHIVELRASRARLVEAGDTERRRLERNLHDGAQSRLVALALNLRLARGAVRGRLGRRHADRRVDRRGPPEPRRAARARPRDPPRGALRARPRAGGALAGRPRAAARSSSSARPAAACPAAVETAAYFVVSEALTNVAKYAHAEHATVRMERADGRLLLEVSDDGVGGASPSAGSGLRGLSDRVAALDGALDVRSPPGGGTRLRVRLPCA